MSEQQFALPMEALGDIGALLRQILKFLPAD
jgi:hypothetical protein